MIANDCIGVDHKNSELMHFLNKVSIFSNAGKECLSDIIQNSNRITLPKNTIVVVEGDEANCMYLVLDGKVKVYLTDDQGREVIINILNPGDYFGELSLIDEERRSATIRTTQKSTFLIISKIVFEKIINKFPHISTNIMIAMCNRIRYLSNNIRNLALLDVYGRVVNTLYEISRNVNGYLTINEKITQQEIADRVGSSREMVSKILKELTLGGYISYNKNSIIILKKLPDNF